MDNDDGDPVVYPIPTPPWSPAQRPEHMLPKEWRYEMRREAQQIVPGIYLGPFQASTNLHKLKTLGITHILCLRDVKEAKLIFPRFPTEFRYMTEDISDNTDQNLITVFPRCKAFIDEALKCGGRVLAHCNTGISIAPAIVIGYLMEMFDWDYATSLHFVQSKRYCVCPISFEHQLKEYAPIAQAQKLFKDSSGSVEIRNKRVMDSDDEQVDDRRSRPAPSCDLAHTLADTTTSNMSMDTD